MATNDRTSPERSEEMNRQLGRLVDLSGDAFIIIDTADRIYYWNRGAEEMYGYTSDEAVGRLVYDLVQTDFPIPFPEIIGKLQQDGRWAGEVKQRTKAGNAITVLTRWELDRGTSGSDARILKSNTDITQQRNASADLQQASAYNRSLLEASIDSLVTIGPDGRLTDVNDATVKITGVPREQLIGSDFSTYFTEPAQASAVYQQVFRDGFVADYALEVRHSDGHITPVLYNASIYRNPSGETIGVFAAARDNSDRKRAEEALARQAAQEALANRAQEILEISTPVLQVWDGVVVAPLIGSLDSQRTQQFMERLLNAIVTVNASVAIVDVTGVPTIDTQTAQHLIDTINAVRLLGARVVLTGVRPAIAQAVVHLGIDLSGITTCPSLMAGLRGIIEFAGSSRL